MTPDRDGWLCAVCSGKWAHIHWNADEVPIAVTAARQTLKAQWFNSDWTAFFDMFEFLVRYFAPASHNRNARAEWYRQINSLLEGQGCAYRFIAEELAPITNPTEMSAVETAANCAIASVGKHISDALSMLPPNSNARATA
jgi:hypothetical protein